MVLIISLLFLFVLTIISLAIFESCILQTKMSQHYSQSIIAFQKAESAFAMAKINILQNLDFKLNSGGNIDSHYTYLLKSCGNDPCYVIDAFGIEKNAKDHIQSIFVLHSNKDKGTDKIEYQQKNWHEIP
jgi:Tfp pilus assembly protein PilX